MADAEPDAPVIRRAEHPVHAAQAVMARRAAAALHPHLAGDEIEFVMEGGDRVGRQLVERGRRLHRLRRRRSCRSAASAPGFSSPAMVPSAITPLKRRRHGEKPWRSAIVSIAMKPILWRMPQHPRLGIAEADPEQHEVSRAGQLLLPSRAPWPGRPWRARPLAGAARLGGARRRRAGRGRLGGHLGILVGGATVATTKSRSRSPGVRLPCP